MKNIIVTAELATIGLKVMRGRDWVFEDQDFIHGGTGIGEIVGFSEHTPGWVKVRWEGSGIILDYRVGGGCGDKRFDLYVYSPMGMNASEPEKPEIDKVRKALADSIVKGKSLEQTKTHTHGTTTAYTGNCLHLPPKTFTLQRGERPEGRRLKS